MEILASLARRVNLPEDPHIVDMGSGMAYLTFAAHAYMYTLYPRVKTMGLEARPKLVASTNEIARSLGSSFDSLIFRQGFIEDAIHRGQKEERCDILMALHACDTATDDALLYGIKHRARLIVVAPCCQKEVRLQMEHALGAAGDEDEAFGVLSGALQHGIFRERTAEMATDAIRALLLDMNGYDTQVFEFVGGAHTAKNVMITAIRREDVGENEGENANEGGEENRTVKSRRRLRRLAGRLGVVTHHLACALGECPLTTLPEGSSKGSKRSSGKGQGRRERLKLRDAVQDGLVDPPPASHIDDGSEGDGQCWRDSLL